MWFTQLKDNKPVESGSIEWEEFKKSFLKRYFPYEKKEVKVKDFIYLRQGNMSVEECPLKFTLLSKYEKSRFVNDACKIVNEECHTTMLYLDMILSRVIVYAQSIQESKFESRGRDAKT